MSPAPQFAALADDTRCQLVAMLHERAMPVHELAKAFDISRPAISRHLRLLREAGLVAETRQGRENVYSLKRRRLKALAGWLEQHWATKLNRLKTIAEARAPKSQMEFDL